MINQWTLDRFEILRLDDAPIQPDPSFMRKVPPNKPKQPKYHYFTFLEDTGEVHDKIVWSLRSNGAMTSRELSLELEIEYYIVQRKLGELQKDFRIGKGGRRFCRVEGKRRATYKVI